jgi:tetratricopeptide (TPR) repeat protein
MNISFEDSQVLLSEFNIAFKYHSDGDLSKAEGIYKKILKKHPSHFDTLRHLGILYQDKRLYDTAEKFFLKAYNIHSNESSILNNLGTIKFLQFKMDDALDFYKKAFKINPKYMPVINNISALYHRIFREEECIKFSKLALSIEPNNLVARSNYAKALSINNKLTEAIKLSKEILKENPTCDNYKTLGTSYRNNGELEESSICFEKALQCDPDDFGSFFNLSASKNNQPNKDIILRFEKKLKKDKNLQYSDKGTIAFALYNSYNKLNNFDKAGKFLLQGNKFLDNWIATDINEEEKYLLELKNIFTSDFIKQKMLSDKKTTDIKTKPIFILGMPRSGTTLCEQILASHSEISGGGELVYMSEISEIKSTLSDIKMISDYKKKLNQVTSEQLKNNRDRYIEKISKLNSKKKFITDKMPHNFVLIGFIKILFPDAKIIYCKRNSMDNCYSLFTHKFVDRSHGYSYNQKTLGKYYNLHSDLMNYWLKIFKDEIYVLNHENLIDDQEKYSKEIINYCGLEWETACLEFYKTKRQVMTASNEQVREPINKKSFAAWKKYESYLDPLKKSLG